MARTCNSAELKIFHGTKFPTFIRGHHVHKAIRNTMIGQVLKTNNLNKTLEYDTYVIGIFKSIKGEATLVAHEPVGISGLFNHFLK